GEKQKKVDALSRVRKASPSANFWPEAMYELGRAYVDLDRNDVAAECFESLRTNAKDGTYVTRALIELGMLARNNRQYDKALGYYKQVVSDLPKNEYTNDAMLAIESIYQSMGEPEAYLAYAESVGDGTAKTEAEKEQIYFNSAEQVFLSGNYQKALTSLQKYFDEYPSGARVTEARFYEAECYMNLGQKENAVDSYAKVMTAPDAGSFLEPAILNYSVLSYGLEHYSDAYNGYTMLREKARMDDNVFAAKVGMMRSAYRAKDYRDALAAVDGVKADSRCDEALGREADFVKAKSLMGTSQRAAAMDIFRRLAAKPSTDEGAEAAYTLIQSTYDEGNFDSVEKMVYDFAADAGTQNYWLAKAFIVLGDAFAEQDNFKQAKATFESIANGYESTGPEDDVLDAVAMRLEKLSQMM
ncbi:MAG: tetratricopeptide repeat protein, partial [Bacteroidales bacterium]|nr:tetratricopeptide repeat protein [Bacteroidales bacterium]